MVLKQKKNKNLGREIFAPIEQLWCWCSGRVAVGAGAGCCEIIGAVITIHLTVPWVVQCSSKL